MSLVKFTSGINNIEDFNSLSEWAMAFISSQKLTRENHVKSVAFRNLSRREKDAIRYQLKKNGPIKTNIRIKKECTIKTKSFNYIKLIKLLISLWIACFLLVDLVNIYEAKGLSTALAWQIAVLVEICIIAGSLSKDKRLKKSAYAFLAYNILIFGFYELNEIHKTHKTNQEVIKTINKKLELKETFESRVRSNAAFHENSIRKMSSLLDKGYVSSVSNALSKINTSLSSSELKTKEMILKLETERRDLESEYKNIYTAIIVGILYFFLRCVLQLYSIWLLRSVSESSF